MERNPTCNPIEPLLSVSADDSKPYPTQPQFHNKAAPMSAPGDQQAQVVPPEDYKNFDIVRATQFGVLERCMELVEAGYDVNQLDAENVSLLHWAAINNRTEVVKYYISKGATIDRIGGDLKSTPLHWASRQGHLPMVVLLVIHGADPSLSDAEGYAAIHLAAQFGHSSVVAYLLAKGQDPDLPDANGMTPLMWTATRIFGPDPMRLLLTFNASVGLRDRREGNTPLHWACMVGNRIAVKLLIDAGADPDAKNGKGLTPLEISLQKKGVVITENLRRACEEKGLFRSKNPFKQMHKNRKFRRYIMLASPFLFLGAFGLVFHLQLVWWMKTLLILLLLASLRALIQYVFDGNHATVVPLAIYLATKFWMYYTWFVFYWSFVNSLAEMFLFSANSALLMYFFWKSWKTDPGIVKSTREDKVKAIIELSERQSFDLDQFCSTCIVRRPLRSKHCAICNKCICKMDHHCPWVDNCIGSANMHYFIGYLFFLLGMISWCAYGAYQYWQANCLAGITPTDGFFTVIGTVMTCSPWVFWIGAVNAGIHFIWVGSLLSCQLYQLAWLALTTNERLNFYRYKHLNAVPISKSGQAHGHSHGTSQPSPFHRGSVQNLVDAMGWQCCGLLKPLDINWQQVYTLEDYAEVVTSQVRRRNVARHDLV